MARIRVETERLRATSHVLQQVSAQLRDLDGRLGAAMGRLDWQVRGQGNIENRVATARGRARALAAQADNLARFLFDRAQAFEEADRQGIVYVGEVNKQFLDARDRWLNNPALPRVSYPEDEIHRAIELGFLLPGVGTVPATAPVGLPRARSDAEGTTLDDAWDEALDKSAEWIDRYQGWRKLLGILAAFALDFVYDDGVVVVKGDINLRDLTGIAKTLGRIRPENLPKHLWKQQAGMAGKISALLSVVPEWLRDFRDYRHDLPKLLGALTVDTAIKGAISYITGAVGYTAGAAAVVFLTGLVGVTAAPALVIAGGVAGAFALGKLGDIAWDWFKGSGARDWFIEGTTQFYREIGQGVCASEHVVSEFAASAGEAMDKALAPAVRAVQGVRASVLGSIW